MSAKQRRAHRSKTGGNNIVEMLESCTFHKKINKKFKVLGAKGLNRIAKIGQGHLCLREENLSIINI